MIRPFRPTGRTRYRLAIPRRVGVAVVRGTGTTDRRTALGMGDLVESLAAAHRWDVLDRLTTTPPTLTLPDLWAHRHALDAYLHATDHPTPTLAALLPAWTAWLAARRLSADRQTRYPRQLATFGLEQPLTALTAPALTAWVARVGLTPGTARSYLAAAQAFVRWARSAGHLDSDPLAGVIRPTAPSPRVDAYDRPDVLALLAVCDTATAAGLALAYGAAADASSIGKVAVRDVDVARRTVRVRGGKTAWRDRVVRVADDLWPFVLAGVVGKLPGALVAPGDRWQWSRRHAEAVERAGLRPLWLRDARHSFAIRLVRAGVPLEVVARQMGHKDATLVMRVYGRFQPSTDEVERWEQRAVAAQTERLAR